MNTKFQELNSKILYLTKRLEQNKLSLLRETTSEYDKEYKEEEKRNLYKQPQKFYSINPLISSSFLSNNPNQYPLSLNIDKGIILKKKINSMEDEYDLKVSKLKTNFDKLTNDLNKLSEMMNDNFESNNNGQEEIIKDANYIKNNLEKFYEEENNKMEQEIFNVQQNLINSIKTVNNYNNGEDLKNQRDILDIEKYFEEVSSDIVNKMNINLNSCENERKEKAREICEKFSGEDQLLEEGEKRINNFFSEMKNKLEIIRDNIIPRFMAIEENKREDFKNNVVNILNETISRTDQ